MEIIFCVGKKKKKDREGEELQNTVISASLANWCSLQQRRVNKFIQNQQETGPD